MLDGSAQIVDEMKRRDVDLALARQDGAAQPDESEMPPGIYCGVWASA